MKNKFTITEEILASIENAKRAIPNSQFVSKMESLALTYAKKDLSISKEWVFSIAASFLLLLSINYYGISLSQTNNTVDGSDTYATLINPSNSIYNE